MQYVGIYARISVQHGNRKDDSIDHQILLGRRWIQEQVDQGNQLKEVACYEDRGYSGTTFERPGFQKMLQDIKRGWIDCIVCKDASRLGRNYLETGNYMERMFPMLHIRLVCISDRYDSEKMLPGSFAGNLKNLMNEWYARDISRKVRMVKAEKRKNGEYLGSKPPYGYMIGRIDGKRVLIEDQKAMAVVRMIIRWHEEGASRGRIQDQLCKMQILPPEQYRRTGQIREEGRGFATKKWNLSTIGHIISRNDDLVQNEESE